MKETSTFTLVFTHCRPHFYGLIPYCMHMLTYHKVGNKWFLDFPEYLDQDGTIEDLERIGGFYELLEIAAEGRNTVSFFFDLAPFDDADSAELIGSSGDRTGAYYYLKMFSGKRVDLEIWVNDMIYLSGDELPEVFYIKKTEAFDAKLN